MLKGLLIIGNTMKNKNITTKSFDESDYDRVCDFFVKICDKNTDYINWNWARFEWMYEHPNFDKSLINLIRLWLYEDKVVGIAVYDMYLGEGFIFTLDEYDYLYDEILKYAYDNLSDDNGFSLCVNDDDTNKIKLLESYCFTKTNQDETIMEISLDKPLNYTIDKDYHIDNLDQDDDRIQWLIFQGFDHGNDIEEFLSQKQEIKKRIHFNKELSACVFTSDNIPVSCALSWYMDNTDYAYLEPVCTIPKYRHRGFAKSAIYESLNNAHKLGATKAYVISDMEFYKKIGFKIKYHYTFYKKSK